MNDNEIKKLYSALLGKGYSTNDLGDEETFRTKMGDKASRKQLYDWVSSKGNFRLGDYDTYESRLTSAASEQPEQSKSTKSTPATETQETPLTEQDKIHMSAGIDRMMKRTKQITDGFNEHMDNMQEYGIGLNFGQTKKGKSQFNPDSGKMEETYLTPAGNRYSSKAVADMESFRYRQAADMSVSGQLRKASQKLAELKAKREERANEVLDETTKFNEEKLTPLGRALIGGQMYVGMQQGDKEKSALDVAIRQTEELIKDLEEQKDREKGVDVGFWRGFGRTVGDFRTWDLGMSDLKDAMTMMNAEDLTGENATEGERDAYNEMMGALYNKEQAEQAYGGNASFWNRAGVMTGYMPSFMLDFAITGGGYGGIKVLGTQGSKAATKVVGKEAIEKMAEQGFKTYVKNKGVKGLVQYATDWTIKALGTTADDLLVRAPLMTNTVQAGKTASDIIDRKLGDVVVNEDGTYDFSNDRTWGSAIWQGEANAIIENYSEMFGAHLDPVVTLGNMGKLANTIGAKRLGGVLAKADAGALGGIMGQTHAIFNKMGVSDYFGEVSEEYYGQMWRTMLNLDDAYQQNPDGTRTNLLATGKFHGDIWGGMALSMGMMGAGKYTLSGAHYVSMKHSVNKADAHANELLGKEVWEPLKTTLDLTTNEDIGSVAESLVNDKDFTNEERAAVLTYIERSLMMRGYNLGTLAQKRGTEPDEDVQDIDESYIDGYNIGTPQEMTDAKNMLDYQRKQMLDIVGTNEEALNSNTIDWLNEARNSRNSNTEHGERRAQVIIDYLNAKQVYDGMIQRVRDDIDGRIDQSNAMIDARTNRTTGMIHGATMKQDDRRVYIIGGNLVQYADKSGIDNSASDGSIIIRDAETGTLEQVAPDAVLNIDDPLNPDDEKMTAAQVISQQFAQEAANKIDGVVTFTPGDTYTITGDDGQMQVQVVANDEGIVDNGDGTVNVSDGTKVFPLSKETIQSQADEANIARVAQFEEQRAIEKVEREQVAQESDRPQYALNDLISLTDENGVVVRGNITADADADGKYEVYTESPINGKRVNLFTREELDNIVQSVSDEKGNPLWQRSENEKPALPSQMDMAERFSAMERIPKDEQGNPLYEQTDSDTAWNAIVEQTEGDEIMAQTVADGMVADKEAELKKLEKVKSRGGATIAEKIASEKERKAAIDAAKQELTVWKRIAGTANRRKQEAESERRRVAEEAAAARKVEEEKMRAEREEAERIEREALNGVPDMVDDTPHDARARGYRRVNGHKIDRQEPVQAVQGKEIAVKFSDDTIVNGRAAVIDANLLQPSHVGGVRNPLHFIDEAQPKERNDEASVLSARKIAGNIRPEEITSSITAYTGAPTVNARGEAIQGNNRSDALRQMWDSHKEQAAQYKQYLKDHADEFGLHSEDIERMKAPVLVNMLDVEDAEAIKLGQYVAQDTESGGTERIKPKNALQRMGGDMRSFANLLLKSNDEETSFASLVDTNGAEVLKWMNQRGYITPTQYKSAFDSKGNLTAEAKNDLRGVMYQSIFKGGSTRLEEMFNILPAKAQRAILATAFRDYDSPNSERMIEEIQNSIRVYNLLSQDKAFVEAKNFKETRMAVEGWKRQYQIDDVTGESYLPAENFSNFALLLATMYKGESQSFIQGTFNKLYDLIQGTQEETLFEHPDNTPRTLAQAIKETLKIDYNGQRRSDVLVGGSTASQRGQQGSTGNAATGERIESGERTADSAGGVEAESTASGETVHQPQSERKGLEQNLDGGRETDRTGVADDSTRNMERSNDRSDLRVFEEGLDTSYGSYSHDSERTRREAESERLVSIAKQHGLFVSDEVIKSFTGKVAKRTGESVIYIDKETGKVTKVKDPYAKSAMKSGVQPEDAAFEHLVHNLLFPETAYTLVGISENLGDVRIVLSQNFVQSKGQPTKEQIAEALAARGLYPEDNYSFGNDLVSVTDVEGDNVLLGEDGTVYFIDPIIRFKKPLREILETLGGTEQQRPTIGEQVQAAEAEVSTNPTEAQKEAGNYKKGHVHVGTFDITIENPKSSIRSGVDESGKKWETKMNNTYGYIRGTEGVDGDHIDVFLSDDIDSWNGRKAFVVDQYNTDGSFDEHKVMLGFNDQDEAYGSYLANYEKGWEKNRKIVVTPVNLEDFEKWIASSHRKTKAFAEYADVKKSESNVADKTNDGYTVEPAQYTTKRGKVLDMQLVKFERDLSKDEVRNAKSLAKELKGWYDREKGGFMMRSTEDAQKLTDAVMEENGETLADAAPVSISDLQQIEPTTVKEEDIFQKAERIAQEEEAKYAEMDANVETANNLSNAEEADELERKGEGTYTDDEVSYENDPISKVMGKPMRTRKQRREFAQRERQRMAERVESLTKKLHLDNVEVITDASRLEGKKQRSKGFYSKNTGKITIVIPNHTSTFDVEQTLLHEAVAHYGLRQLFGEHFDMFLDNVFNNADETIRRRIVDMSAKNGWNFRKATEEYLATLAENTEFENTNANWWSQIKDFFLNMLHKIGFEDFRGVTLTDNELRYILWRSYENLAEPGRYRSILGEAADVAKQYELKVGNYQQGNNAVSEVADNDDALYRDGDPEIHERELARDRYEMRVKSGMFQSREAMQDSMLGLKEAMNAIIGKGTNIEDVDGFENAYLGENRLSSVNKAEADAFAQILFKPMLDEVAKLAKNEAERMELTEYMMAKHGLERNQVMAERDFVEYQKQYPNGQKTLDDFRERDYAGLTALTGFDDVAQAEMEAEQMVAEYEAAHNTADLWDKVNAVSKAILSKSYECGMMSKETFDKVSDMYKFYIPLRGFDEKTSSEAYAYLSHKNSVFNAPIKKAQGRTSKADDPFANLQSMAESAIMQGNRNKLVKQRFLNFVLNHPSDLVSVSDLWVTYDAVSDEWKPIFPDNIDSTDSPEVVERKMNDFETKMEALAQTAPDLYKRGKDTIGIPYRVVESRDMRQHQVVVKRGGRDYVVTINGNPRAAQALNGQTNPDNDTSGAIGAILRAGEKINRQLSAFYTTRNPDFIVSNFMRDMLYTNSMVWVKESPNYALRFHRNYTMVNPIKMKRLLAKYRKGTLDMSDKTEAMFHQFMMNGGETGYANIRDIEQHKNDIRRELKRANGKLKIGRALSLLSEKFDELNRAVENCARFAAFITSREMGRNIDRAIYDAKEISVNFNKKGSGAKFYDSIGQTKTGNASALVSGLGRSGYVFWNAAIQGTTNFGRQLKRHPAKAFTGMATMFLLGAIIAYLGGDDDDDDKNAYYNLPEYVRRSNIMFRAGDSWISIPLPIEYRAFYGMGELMTSIFSGKEHLTGGEIAEAIAGQATQVLPIDFLEGGGGVNAFVPSATKPLWEAFVSEKSWTGMPLYKGAGNKDAYNKNMPEWTKAYKSANKHLVNLAAVLNDVTGGDPYTKGSIDINPAKIEYILNGYFGGVSGTIDKMTKTWETISGTREYDPRSFLVWNRLVKAGDERTEYRAVNNEYSRLKEEHDRLKTRLKHYEEDTDNDIFDYAEKIDFLYNSPEYERYEIFEDYKRDIDDLYEELKETVDDEERKEIETELNDVKKEMIQEMNLTRERK